MEREHKIKVVFNSKTYGIITIEEEFRKDKNETNIIKNVNTSLGMSSFPTAKLEINVTSKFPNLISIKTGDEVSIYGCEIDKSFEKLFQGVLLSVVVKSTKETIELVIESVSAFYFLQKRQLNYQNFIIYFCFFQYLQYPGYLYLYMNRQCCEVFQPYLF